MLARERVEVFPRLNLNARVLQIGVDYNVPPAEVIAILTQAVENVQGVAQELKAFARLGGFAESTVTYEVKYFMHDYSQRDRIDADIRKAVWYALRRNGIPIPYPIRSVVRYTPPPTRQHPDHEEILDRLGRVDILEPLTQAARETIAAAARVHVYSAGETIIRKGTEGDSMFIVHQGAVSVQVDDKEVARLKDEDFFGEMALLTGETRTADVVALGDVVIIEIAKDALHPVLVDHPDLADAISAIVMERRGSLDSARMHSADEVQQSVLSRIRAYFGL
jgi:CRP-like cAMP-binding protein